MKKYIVCELVEAEESGDGYRVYHKDNMEAYCPKDLFNKVYIEVNDNKDLPSGVSISQQMVNDFIDKVESGRKDYSYTDYSEEWLHHH